MRSSTTTLLYSFIVAFFIAFIITFVFTVQLYAAEYPNANQVLSNGQKRGFWISQLRSEGSGELCCAEADGNDTYWESDPDNPGQYRAEFRGKMYPVPPSAIVTTPNLLGIAKVWMQQYAGDGGLLAWRVRCFMPGAAY